MSDLMNFIIALGIGVVILIVQQLLSKRENWILGGILPIVSLLFAIGVFHFRNIQFSIRNLLPFIALIVIQISIWEEGRKKLEEKKELELNKMKSRDL
jgi:ABC-type antimicrobial peptide transport system permease subunit